MKSSDLHARFGTADEFYDGNKIIPEGVVCFVQDADDKTTEFRVGDGVTEFDELSAFKLSVPEGDAVASPTGGDTVDAEARAAIDDIRDRLTAAGITA